MYFNAMPYYNSMDREGSNNEAPTAPLGVVDNEMPIESPDYGGTYGFGTGDIGMSVPLGISAANAEGVQAKIRSGAKNMELGFAGTIHGNRNAQTPEMYGEDQRRALREIQKINDVKFTTHAAYGIMGMMGQDQQGNFSTTQAQTAREEVKRAIDFAADVAGGGSVVVHTGEFERPLTHIYPKLNPDEATTGHYFDENGNPIQNLARDQNTGQLLFKKRQTEFADATWQLMDDRTGQVFQTVQADRYAAQPVWLRSKENHPYQDKNGNTVNPGDYVDYDGNLVADPFNIVYERKHEIEGGQPVKDISGRVPEFDKASGRFKTKLMSVEDFEQEAKEYNQSYQKILGQKPDYWDRATGREMFMKSTLLTQAGHSRGWSLQYASDMEKLLETRKKLDEAEQFYHQLDKNLPEDEKWKIMKQDQSLMRYVGSDLINPEVKHPLQMIAEAKKDVNTRLEYAQQASTAQEMQAEDTIESMRHLRTPEKFIEKHAAKEYGLLGVHALQKSKDPNKPIVLTMENIFPERFGGHPTELKELINTARRKMVDYLTEEKLPWTTSEGDYLERTGDGPGDRRMNEPGRNPYYKPGLSKQEAQQLAEKHIKATIDTGHMNMWRKYWQKLPGEDEAQSDARFNKWMLNQVEDLAKEGYIGNMHLTDNYGWQDDHLAPGQGNAPVKEVVQILKKYGYKGAMTVEPGADATTDNGDVYGLMKTWRHFGAPIHGTAGGGGGLPNQNWSNVQHSYFGRSYPPNFVFGSYSPSNDWTLFTQVPME